ncbi:hypothetical protein [Pseudomonas putida]|uniref:hypothetical protein n=1 Tax=Pseudomonas putida TaxID=303 RepID=UPI000B074719|nr:hypothetical protein [Pseudomonas putida]
MRKIDGSHGTNGASGCGSPDFLGRVRWPLVVLLCLATGFALVVLFWSGDTQPDSPWFWSRVLALPLIIWSYLYGLRLLAH